MSVIKVRKQFELRGRSEVALERRIGTMAAAIHKQNGAVLGVKKARLPGGACRATVSYHLALVSGLDE